MTTPNSAELAQSVEKALQALTQTYDDIGLTTQEKETRRSNVYKALQDCLKEQLNITNKEKERLVEECTSLIQSIRQMEKSIDSYADDQTLRITLPLVRCRQQLQERLKVTTRRHAERFEQVKELSTELRKYAEFLEPAFLRIELPPTEQSKAVGFNLSPSYMQALDQEFTRVYGEFQRRASRIQEVATEIVRLWAELGTHEIQTDRKILQYYNTAPEQLGLRAEDARSLNAKLRSLREEKESRERHIAEMSDIIMPLWEKLNIDEAYREQFLATHRGVSQRTIVEIEQELERLTELKRENLHIFVEDARQTLQRLWDELYYSEDEMLEFTAAFTDEYTDALLSIHEAEIAHLEQLVEERRPILNLIDKHQSLLNDREQLAISSTDASRLMARGGTSGARDPTRLLREEKMRKRLARDMPKVEAELRVALEQWEEDYGQPFTVRGEDYLEKLSPGNKLARAGRSSSRSTASGAPNLRTPSTPAPQTRGQRSHSVRESKAEPRPILKHSSSTASTAASTTVSTAVSTTSNIQRSNAISRPKTPGVSNNDGRPKTSHSHRPKTPTGNTVKGTPSYATITKTPNRTSRPALTSATHEPPSTTGGSTTSNEPRSLKSYKSVGSIRRKKVPPPPTTPSGGPKLSDSLVSTPSLTTSIKRGDSLQSQRSSRDGSLEHSIRAITPELNSARAYHNGAYLRNGASSYKEGSPTSSEGLHQSPQQLHPRAFSGTSSESGSTAVSSENWETFDDSGDEEDAGLYYQKLRLNSGQKAPLDYAGYRPFGGLHTNSSIAIVGDDDWDDHERN
ncbi:microtubule associated protein-domain-containing protein [Kalaharituber pfeilii]|nr:microtubule associated protein-domain-containing protein [Kalaharituber pfeilii]